MSCTPLRAYLSLEHAFRPFELSGKVEVGYLYSLQFPSKGGDVVHLFVLRAATYIVYVYIYNIRPASCDVSARAGCELVGSHG